MGPRGARAGLSSSGLVEVLRGAGPPNPRRRRRAHDLKVPRRPSRRPRITLARDEADRPNGGSTERPSSLVAVTHHPMALGRRRGPPAPPKSGGEVGRPVSVSAPAPSRRGHTDLRDRHHHTKPAAHRLGRAGVGPSPEAEPSRGGRYSLLREWHARDDGASSPAAPARRPRRLPGLRGGARPHTESTTWLTRRACLSVDVLAAVDAF